MSEDNKQEDDHSIEDILASIRSIIADEDADEPIEEGESLEIVSQDASESGVAEQPEQEFEMTEMDPIAREMEESGDEDILELTDDMMADPTDEGCQEPQSQDDIDALFDENVEANVEPEKEVVAEEPVQEEVREPAEEEASIEEDYAVDLVMQDLEDEEQSVTDDSLLSEVAAASAAGALSRLSENVGTTKSSSPSSNMIVGTITLEDIVRQEVRPLIKSWLDDNLPSLVERLVEKEISNLKNKL